MYLIKKYWWLSILIILFVGFQLYEKMEPETSIEIDSAELLGMEDNNSIKINEANDDLESPDELKVIYIDVKGAVVSPGVYQIEGNKRVSDAINLAGGFTEKAYMDNVNLAQKVFDEMVIFVGEQTGNEQAPTQMQQQTQLTDGRIKINIASLEELQTIPGIGLVKAEAIVTYREENGHFQNADDLLNITGIGEKTLDKIRDKIIVP